MLKYLSVIEKWADSEEQTLLYNFQGQSLRAKTSLTLLFFICIRRKKIETKMDTVTTCATLLFFTELYHILGHSVILFGIR